MFKRIKRFRGLMWVSGIIALKSLILDIGFLIAGKSEPSFLFAIAFISFVWVFAYARDKTRQLEEKRSRLWKQKHRTVENIRPLIYKECARFWAKESEVRLVEPLLALGPGPYLDADIDKITSVMPNMDYTESYFGLIQKNILWPKFVFSREYRWSEQLWEEVDRQAPVMPKDWEGYSTLPWAPTWAMRIG